MKYITPFAPLNESGEKFPKGIHPLPNEGDYITITVKLFLENPQRSNWNYQNLNLFMKNRVGKVMSVNKTNNSVLVSFGDIHNYLMSKIAHCFYWSIKHGTYLYVSPEEIVFSGKDLEELEAKIQGVKFGL